MNIKPLLSICIPTYNRSEYLKKTLESIVVQSEFRSGKVEIVVSDNASTDNTEQVVIKYCERYNNIFYYKNEKNVRDWNFPLVISKANGMYRKLCNDTMLFDEESLSVLISTIEANIKEKPVIFWHQIKNNKKNIVINRVEDAIEKISYWATSISCYGVWQEDFSYNEEGCEEFLWQVPNLYRDIVKKKTVVICTKTIAQIQEVKGKDLTYGLYQVFYVNFLNFVQALNAKGNISQKVIKKVKKDLLIDFFCWLVVAKKVNGNTKRYSESENFEELIYKAYSSEKYYWIYCFKWRFSYLVSLLKKKIKHIVKGKNV